MNKYIPVQPSTSTPTAGVVPVQAEESSPPASDKKISTAKTTTCALTNSSKKIRMIKLLPPNETDNPKKKNIMKRKLNLEKVSTSTRTISTISTKL